MKQASTAARPAAMPALARWRRCSMSRPFPTTARAANTSRRSVALVIEADCIGCTKCIQACPVDAIIGGAKHMHTVIEPLCTGCELCVPACPVDCIVMVEPALVDPAVSAA